MPNLTVAQPDVTLLLDLQGVIREATLSSALAEEQPAAWVGQPWADTVAGGEHSVAQLVADARRTGVSGFRLVAQRLPSGRELPIEYTTVRLGGDAGLLAVGKNLAAVAEVQTELVASQQAMERDYWKLRGVETRYRLLFETADEPVLVVHPTDLQVIEANPAAVRTFGGHVPGGSLLDSVAPNQRHRFAAMLVRAREYGRAPGAAFRLGAAGDLWLVRATEMTVESGPVLLLKLSPASGTADAQGERPSVPDLVERIPDGFVVVDGSGLILEANQAFLDLVQIPAKASILGEPLGRWLGRPGADVSVLLATLHQHGVVRRLATALHGELGSDAEVEVSAVGNADVRPRFVAMFVRDVGLQLPGDEVSAREALSSAIGALAQQVGKTPLLKLVRSTVEEVEKHYVTAALHLTRGNRTAAAELLGLSRQSLYAKLWRYGLDGGGEGTSD